MVYNPIASAIGLEIEAKDVPISMAMDAAGRAGIGGNVVDDGSIRSYESTLFGIRSTDVPRSLREILKSAGIYSAETQLGCELVSKIIQTTDPEWERYVFNSLEFLSSMGEGVASSTSIHVHVNAMGLPVDMVHNLINLWMALEAGIYRISCGPLGYFRGLEHKDAHYSRPLVPEGPLVWSNDGRLQPCYSVDCLMKAKNITEFAKAYGRSDRNATRRWHTPRYSGLNFHSLFRQGSIEFRTFNFSLVPAHVIAWVELCKNMVRKAMGKGDLHLLPKNPYGTKDMSLDFLFDILELEDDRLLYILEELWNMGSFPSPLRGYRMTHLDQREGFSWGRDIRKELLPDCIDRDAYVHRWDDDRNADRKHEIEGSVTIPRFLQTIDRYARVQSQLRMRPRVRMPRRG